MLFLFGLFSMTLSNLLAQSAGQAPEETKLERLTATMQSMVDQVIGTGRFVITTVSFSEANFADTLKGKCVFIGIENADFKATFTDQGMMTNFNATAPKTEDISLPEFDAVKEKISDLEELGNLFIPPFVRDRIRFDSYSMDFNANSIALDSKPAAGTPAAQSLNARYEKMAVNFKLLEDWQPLKQLDVKLGKILVGFEVKFPTNQTDTAKQSVKNKRAVAGTISGTLKWKETTFKLSSNIPEKKADWQISADVSNLGVTDIYQLFNVDDITGMPLPSFLNQKINKATVKVKPLADQPTIELIGLTSIADVNFLIKRTTNIIKDTVYHDADKNKDVVFNTKDNKYGIVAGFSLSQNFSFASLLPALSFMDKFPLKNFAVIYSTQDTKPGKSETTSLPIIQNLLSGDPSIYKGLTFAVWMDMDRSLGINKTLNGIIEAMPVQSLMFKANVPENPTNLILEGLMNFRNNLNIANVFFFRNFRLQMKPTTGNPEFSLLADVDLKVDANNILRFRGGMGFQPGALAVGLKGGMVNDWVGPFGFKPLTIGGITAEAGLNFSTVEPFPVPDNMLFSGKIKLGDMSGEATIGIDINEPTRNMIDAKMYKLSINNLIDAFCSKQIMDKIPSFLDPYFEDTKLDTAEIKLVQPPNAVTTVGGKIFYPGYRVLGDAKFMGWGGRFEFGIEGFTQGFLGGITAKAKMDPIRISAGDLKLLHLTGAGDQGKPEMIIDLSTTHLLTGMTGAPNSSSSTTSSAKMVYLNCGISILGVTNANALIDLTPKGFTTYLDGKVYGFLQAGIDARIESFINPMLNTFVRVEGKAGSILKDVQNFLSKKVLGRGFSFDIMKKGFSLDRIYFEGKLDDLKTGAKAKVEFTIAGKKNSIGINVSVGGALKLAEDIAEEIVKNSMPILADIQKAFDDAAKAVKEAAEKAAKEMKETADKAVNLAKNTTRNALNVANQAKSKLSQGAQTAFNGTKDGFKKVGDKTQDFFTDFGKYTKKTVEKIFNKSVDKLENGWGKFTDAMKKAFTGGDNEERIMTDGPAFRIITKFQGSVLSSIANPKSNFPVFVKQRTNISLETWQLIPNDKNDEGSFYLVSGYSGLLITKPWSTHSILIPHESDHKNRERMLMEPVIGEPGWYYLKYFDYDRRNNVNYYTYIEVKNVFAKGKPGFESNVAQWVLAPVEYGGNNKPGEYGKFKFEKAGDIDWQRTKIFPPFMTPAVALVEGNRYQFNGEPEQYIYSSGSFRWIPDVETLVAGKLDLKPLTILPNNQQVSTVLGTPIPSRKDGALVQAQNEPEIFIMDNGMRRWIPDIETFNMMSLNTGMIQFVSKADILAIPIGEPIPSKFVPKTVVVERAVYRQAGGDGTVFIVLNKTLRPIPNNETLFAMGYDLNQVQTITAQEANSISKGPLLPDRKDNRLIKSVNSPEVYIMEKGLRRWIPDIETFNSMGLNSGNITTVSNEDFLNIPKGPDVVSLK